MAEAEADMFGSFGETEFVVVQKRKIGMIPLVFLNPPALISLTQNDDG